MVQWEGPSLLWHHLENLANLVKASGYKRDFMCKLINYRGKGSFKGTGKARLCKYRVIEYVRKSRQYVSKTLIKLHDNRLSDVRNEGRNRIYF